MEHDFYPSNIVASSGHLQQAAFGVGANYLSPIFGVIDWTGAWVMRATVRLAATQDAGAEYLSVILGDGSGPFDNIEWKSGLGDVSPGKATLTLTDTTGTPTTSAEFDAARDAEHVIEVSHVGGVGGNVVAKVDGVTIITVSDADYTDPLGDAFGIALNASTDPANFELAEVQFVP